jgi:acetyl-CoA carboxylase carboxyl transferase subunit alpha
MAARLKMYLAKTLRELQRLPTEELLTKRYEKFRRMGPFIDSGAAANV